MENGRDESEGYDRAKEVKQFDDSKIGVKGLVDSGIASIPRFFIYPAESLPRTAATATAALPPPPPVSNLVPIVDLSGFDSDRRSIIVDQIRDASRTGFFQVINHGIPTEILDRTIVSVKTFNEQPTEIKALHYNRDNERSVSFASNFDLYTSKAASWRDTIQLRWDPNFNIGEIPEICRTALVVWDRQVQRLGETLMEILSEGLGVEAGRLKELSCTEGKLMVAHYYPFCPQPDLTLGTASHTDAAGLTVLLQDQIGGLQVKHGEHWLDVPYVPGALIINIGTMLQIISNDEYRSMDHRVLANHHRQPRISVAVFLSPCKSEEMYGPLPELISPDKPALYRPFKLSEFKYTKGLGEKSLISQYQL